MGDGMRWYAVHTLPKSEERAVAALVQRVAEAGLAHRFGCVGRITAWSGGDDGSAFFPGYLALQVELDDETWALVKGTAYVTGFVGGTTRRPPPLPDDVVDDHLEVLHAWWS